MQNTPEMIKTHNKDESPLVCLTAYSKPMAHMLDAHVDILLVGDSLGMVLYGMESTQGVTLDMMINHGKAVMRGAKKACVVVDMPFNSYEKDKGQALENAKKIINETGCAAVKLEGGAALAPTINHLVQAGVNVMAHIGLLPQSAPDEGGFKIKGKTDAQAAQLIEDARAVEAAGAFAIVIEGVVEEVAKSITHSVSIPTIGIGASAACDGQILVSEDMLGLSSMHVPKFVKQFAILSEEIEAAVQDYARDVRSRAFPATENIYKGKK